MDNDPRSLKSIFADAEGKRLALEQSYDARSESYVDTLSSALNGYSECLQLIDALSIFSPNETIEDISSSDLPYLLINFHIAELIQKSSLASPADRLRTLGAARDAYERFLHLLDNYDLLSARHKRFLEQYTDDSTNFSTIPTDPSARRDSKIANFKTEKDLKAKLEFLRRQPEYANPDAAGGATGDEEAVREVHIAHIELCAHKTFQGLEGLNRERDVLLQAPEPLFPSITSVDQDERRRLAEHGEDFSERLDRSPMRRLHSAVGGPLLTKEGKPLQPFTLVGTRQDIASGVFRPGHNLPTMSIDEYLDEEKRRGGIIEGGGEASGRIPEPDEDNIEKADQDTMKARAWDDFTESNARGSGNTINRG